MLKRASANALRERVTPFSSLTLILKCANANAFNRRKPAQPVKSGRFLTAIAFAHLNNALQANSGTSLNASAYACLFNALIK